MEVTNEDAIKWLENLKNDIGNPHYECLWHYAQAIDEICALLEEQEAKSPVVREKNGYWNYVCPTCGSHDEDLFHEWNYCPFCGQAVKWE